MDFLCSVPFRLFMYLHEYFSLFFFVGFSLALSIALFLLSFFLAVSSGDPEKLSAYECGFNPFEDARSQFDIRFYLVAILFIIFDLEISFLFPWALTLKSLGGFGFWSMMLFLFILTVGFVFEWQKGALEWE